MRVMGYRGYIVLMGLTALVGCGERGEDDPIDSNYDKEVMLMNLGQQAQVHYAEWQDGLNSLQSSLDAFANAPSSEMKSNLQAALNQSYAQWNRCAVFEIGPAADANLRFSANSFPTDTATIEENIAAGSWDLGMAKNALAIGYPALDYLLFDSASTASLMDGDAARRAYIQDLVTELKALAEEVTAGWKNYQTEFSSNTAASVGSPIGMLVNEINFEFELLKNARIGIPMGKKTLGVTQPEKVEGLYSDQSASLAMANLEGITTAFNGGSGEGLDDYLNHLQAKHEGQLLADKIQQGFEDIQSELQKINSLKGQIAEDPSELEPLYRLIEQQVVLLKTDMPSHLGVQITYQDNDGD